MGQEGAWTSDVYFTDVRLGDDALIGGSEDIGYRAALTSLARGRIHIAALAVGAAQRALDESLAFAASATQGGTPVGEFQLVQAMLADQQTQVMAGRALVRDAAQKWLSGEDRRIAPSVAKLFCTEMWPIWQCRFTAAPATCAVCLSSGSIATCACCVSTREPARSSG